MTEDELKETIKQSVYKWLDTPGSMICLPESIMGLTRRFVDEWHEERDKQSKLSEYKFDTSNYINMTTGVKRNHKTGRLESIKKQQHHKMKEENEMNKTDINGNLISSIDERSRASQERGDKSITLTNDEWETVSGWAHFGIHCGEW